MGGIPNCSAAAAALVLCVACAKQMPPPGGPPDTTPPRVVWTRPTADTTGVPLDARIVVRFSERMDRRSVERAVFVSPRAQEPSEVRAGGEELEIRLPGGLRPDRTYVVTVGAECADLSRNRMTSSYSFAFATGPRLNRGSIQGRVAGPAQQGSQTYVWAYDLGQTGDPDPGRVEAAYVTQPGADGGYAFPRLGPGRYRVFAVGDRDRDRAYTAGKDLLAVPPADVTVPEEDRAMGLGPLRMSVRDTTGPRLTGVRTPDASHMVLRFDEPVRPPDSVSVTAAGKRRLAVSGVFPDAEDSSRVWLVTAPQDPAVQYAVAARGFSDLAGNAAPDQASVEVQGESRPDTRGPSLLRVEPAAGRAGVAPDAVLRMVFDEAVQADVPADFWVRSDSSSAPSGRFDRAAPNVLTFRPEKPWTPGAAYRLVGRGVALKDGAGNACEDSVAFRFTVRDPNELGDLSGRMAPSAFGVCLDVIGLDPGGDRRRLTLAAGDTAFSAKGLLPGRYRIQGFEDTDGNGSWDPGRPVPFSPAEPIAVSADTVDVRSRWEAEAVRRLRFDAVYPVETEEE